MKVLGVNFSYENDNKLISMCRLSNENSKGGIDLEYIGSFKEDKNYDLKNLIRSQVINLGVDYVVVDKYGVEYTLYKDLKDILGDKVIGLESNIKKENEIINRLTQCPLLEALGFDLKYKMCNGGYVKFDIKAYGGTEYLNIRSLALANYYILEKLFEEEKKENSTNKFKGVDCMMSKHEEINRMLDAMKDIRERDINSIRKTLKNNGLLTQTRESLNVELHRLQKEIEVLEEVKTRCGFICEDDK